SVQLALEDDKKSAAERKLLQAREKALLGEHRDAWLGPLAAFTLVEDGNEFHFARGWLDSAVIVNLSVHLARALAPAPQARLLRRLVLVDCNYEGWGGYAPGSDVEEVEYPGLSALRGARHLGNVRLFQLGDVDGERQFHTYPNALALPEVLPALPRLTEL